MVFCVGFSFLYLFFCFLSFFKNITTRKIMSE